MVTGRRSRLPRLDDTPAPRAPFIAAGMEVTKSASRYFDDQVGQSSSLLSTSRALIANALNGPMHNPTANPRTTASSVRVAPACTA